MSTKPEICTKDEFEEIETEIPQGKLFKILCEGHVFPAFYFSWRFTRKTKEYLIFTLCDFPF